MGKIRTRRKCQFNAELQKAYSSFKIKNLSDPHDVVCNICRGEIDIGNSGRNSLEKYLRNRKHLDAINAASSSQVVRKFFPPNEITTDNLFLGTKEGTYVFHTIEHTHSFRFLDCTSKLIAIFLKPNFH